MPSVVDLQSQLDRLDAENAQLRREVESLRATVGDADRGPMAERFFETIIDNMYDGVAVVDETGIVKYESPSVERITGFPVAEVVGRNFLEFLHPDELPLVTELFASHLEAEGEWRTAELRFRHASGDWITLEARAVNLIGVPAINGIVAIYRDVTEQRLAERRLAELSAEVPGVLYQLRTPRDSSRFEIPYISEGVQRIFGIDPDEIRANPLHLVNLIHAEDRSRYLEIAGDAAARGMAFQLDVRCIDRSGVTRCFRISAAPTECDDGELLYNGIAMDVTSEQRTRERLHELTVSLEEKVLERTEKLRAAYDALQREETEKRRLEGQIEEAKVIGMAGEMITGVAHDLHQPLTAIGIYAGGCLIRLEKGTLDETETTRVLQEIKEASLRAADVVRRAREFTRKRSFVRRPEVVNDICGMALKLGAVSLRDRAVRVEEVYGADLPRVVADRIPMAQVVLNLLSNASEALQVRRPEDRRIILRTSLEGQFVRVDVEDNGVGIPSGERDRIFDRFVTTKDEGLGLGLAMCRSIVKLHDGRIWVDDSPLGGCAFHFTLPISKPAPSGGSSRVGVDTELFIDAIDY